MIMAQQQMTSGQSQRMVPANVTGYNSTVPMVYQQSTIPNTGDPLHRFKGGAVCMMSVVVLALAGVLVIVQIIDMVIGNDVSMVGTGLWCGVIFIAAGLLGVVINSSKTWKRITGLLVLSTLASVLSVGPIASGTFGIVYAIIEEESLSVVMNVMIVVTGVLSGCLLLVISVMSCQAICCGTDMPSDGQARQVQYITSLNAHQPTQMILVPMDQAMAMGAPAHHGTTSAQAGAPVAFYTTPGATFGAAAQPVSSAPAMVDDQSSGRDDPPAYDNKAYYTT